MKIASLETIRFVLVSFAVLMLLPFHAEALTKKRTCGSQPGQTLQHFLDEIGPGDTLIVSGVCRENVVIGEGRRNLIIEAEGAAIIDGSGDPSAAAVLIRGRSIAIKGFTIIAGRLGIQVARGGTATIDGNTIRGAVLHGVLVNDNSFARIVDNTIEQNGVHGICVCEHSSAEIGFRGDAATTGSPNTVRSNKGNGITVSEASYAEMSSNLVYGNVGSGIAVNESSTARIGFQAGPAGTFASANTVEGNGNRGIFVTRSSSARIVENIVRNNTGDGVGVFRVSHADVASNQIDGNTGNGVHVAQNSGVNLGSDAGSLPQDLPNSTAANNFGAGVRCTVNSYVQGRQGTLNGNNGPQDIAGSCFSAILP